LAPFFSEVARAVFRRRPRRRRRAGVPPVLAAPRRRPNASSAGGRASQTWAASSIRPGTRTAPTRGGTMTAAPAGAYWPVVPRPVLIEVW